MTRKILFLCLTAFIIIACAVAFILFDPMKTSTATIIPTQVETSLPVPRPATDVATGSSTTLSSEEKAYYSYEPKRSITAYELSRLTPYFPPATNFLDDRLLKLSEREFEKLGTAQRHLRRISEPWEYPSKETLR